MKLWKKDLPAYTVAEYELLAQQVLRKRPMPLSMLTGEQRVEFVTGTWTQQMYYTKALATPKRTVILKDVGK